jgi:AcrR family transcriptional regulator
MTETIGRRERKKREMRQAIAAAAMRLFTERGYDHVAIAEIAEAADVSVNTIFNYFPTKEDLFFGQHEPMEAGLAQLIRTREPGESVVGFLPGAFPRAGAFASLSVSRDQPHDAKESCPASTGGPDGPAD